MQKDAIHKDNDLLYYFESLFEPDNREETLEKSIFQVINIYYY